MTSAPDTATLRPDRYVAGGDVIARDADGRVVFVRGALPGESATVRVVDEKRDFARAEVVDVVEASPHRVVPPCPMRRAGCGGCDWQHVAVPAQLEAKASIVVDALRRTGRIAEPPVTIGAAVAPTGYRTTVRVVGSADGRAGFRVERSHATVDAAGCLVAHPGVADLLVALRVAPEVEVTLRASVATGERTALWSGEPDDVSGLADDVATGPDAAVHEDVAGLRFRVSAASFFQSGPAAAELLVDAVRRAAPELAHARHVVDAYAGVGVLAAAAAPGARITAVESSRPAVADACENLAGRDATVVRGEFGRWRPDRRRGRVDVVIADPARSGLGRPGVAAVAASGAATVVLVSCDPVSLARDAGLLASSGYHLDTTEVLDLFPHTHHVETVSRFTQRRSGVHAR